LIPTIFSGKIRAQLLSRLLVNPSVKVHLRQLERELNVSSNTVRLELNKLAEIKLIQEVETTNGRIKKFSANKKHPLFTELRSIVLKNLGIDQLLETVLSRLGELEQVYLTGTIAEGKPSIFIDLILVGKFDRDYLNNLIIKSEGLINKKIRVAVYSPEEFSEDMLSEITNVKIFDHGELE
jgi:predicted nucleotidyltransferase